MRWPAPVGIGEAERIARTLNRRDATEMGRVEPYGEVDAAFLQEPGAGA